MLSMRRPWWQTLTGMTLLHASLHGIAHASTMQVSALTEVEATRSRAFAGAGIALGHDPTLVWLNPASAAAEEEICITLAGNRGLFDEVTGQGTLSFPLTHGVLSAGLHYSDAGTGTFNASNGETLALDLQQDLLFLIGFSKLVVPGITAGFAGKILNSTLFGEYTSRALAGDLGLQVGFGPHLKVGVAVRNAGTQVTYLADAIPAPLSFHGGIALGRYLPNGHAILIVSDVEYLYVEKDLAWKTGIEYRIARYVALRGGMRRSTREEIKNYSGGIGVSAGGYRLDYSVRTAGEFSLPHSLSLTIAFK